MKQCEVCEKEIPEDFQNFLCLEHYEAQEAENKLKFNMEEAEITEMGKDTSQPQKEPVEVVLETKNGILDTNYQENPEKEDKEQWETNIALFRRNGKILWHPTRDMYEFVKNYCLERTKGHTQFSKHIWQPMVVDIGCGIGAGSNTLSQEASFVWGIDKNETSVRFAQEAFTRVKNGIYYSSQLTFDHVDILEDTREFMKFDVLVAIEIIEHIDDYKKFLSTIVRKLSKPDSVFFISTPNRKPSTA